MIIDNRFILISNTISLILLFVSSINWIQHSAKMVSYQNTHKIDGPKSQRICGRMYRDLNLPFLFYKVDHLLQEIAVEFVLKFFNFIVIQNYSW